MSLANTCARADLNNTLVAHPRHGGSTKTRNENGVQPMREDEREVRYTHSCSWMTLIFVLCHCSPPTQANADTGGHRNPLPFRVEQSGQPQWTEKQFENGNEERNWQQFMSGHTHRVDCARECFGSYGGTVAQRSLLRRPLHDDELSQNAHLSLASF